MVIGVRKKKLFLHKELLLLKTESGEKALGEKLRTAKRPRFCGSGVVKENWKSQCAKGIGWGCPQVKFNLPGLGIAAPAIEPGRGVLGSPILPRSQFPGEPWAGKIGRGEGSGRNKPLRDKLEDRILGQGIC